MVRSITTIRANALSLAVLVAFVIPATIVAQAADPSALQPSEKWAEAMDAFAEEDAANAPRRGGVVFVGSSSIRFWDLSTAFPDLKPPALNRGFGGSEISDSIRHFDLLVAKHRPRLVVLYAGDNDISNGKSSERVAADFQEFANLVHSELPGTRLAFVAIKPSLARWELAPRMQQANAAIRAACDEQEVLTFVDIWKPMLGPDDRPRPDLFLADGLHLNKAGYRVWNAMLNPLLVEPSPSRDTDATAAKN